MIMGFEPITVRLKGDCSTIEPYQLLLTKDVLLHEGPNPFETQNASHLHMLSLLSYSQSPLILDTAVPFQSFMQPALG